MHTGRSAYNHLLALAQTHGIPRSARRRADRPRRPARRRDASAPASSRSAWASGSGSRRRCSATRRRSCSTSPSTGSTRRASTGSATCSRRSRPKGRTVFVSSHLMSEMALTADHLIVIGRGRLIADMSVDEFVRGASKQIVRVRSPQATQLRELLAGPTASRSTRVEPALLEVSGLTAEQIGDARRRARHRAPRADPAAGVARGGVHGPHPRRASSSRRSAAGAGARERAGPTSGSPRLERHRAGHAGAGAALRVDEAPLAALDPLVAARRRRC